MKFIKSTLPINDPILQQEISSDGWGNKFYSIPATNMGMVAMVERSDRPDRDKRWGLIICNAHGYNIDQFAIGGGSQDPCSMGYCENGQWISHSRNSPEYLLDQSIFDNIIKEMNDALSFDLMDEEMAVFPECVFDGWEDDDTRWDKSYKEMMNFLQNNERWTIV